jgi:biotin transport system substrate-specific component
MHPVLAALLGALAIAVGAQISIPLPPVPMTLQTLAVLSVGLIGGPKRGLAATAAYLGLVLLGVPVLAEGARAGGTAFLSLKSAGYVVGFLPGAWVAGQVGRTGSWVRWTLAGLAAHGVVLALGVTVLAAHIGLGNAVTYGLSPFLPGAVVKSLAAAGIVAAWKRIRPA